MPSNCFRRLRGGAWEGVWRLISGKETGIQDQFYDLIGQGKLLFGHSRLLHSLPSGAFTDLHVFVRPGTVAAAQANLYLANRRKNISVVGALSRAISIPSVSGPSFQVCGYHIDRLLSEPSQVLEINSEKGLMAVCGSRSALTDRCINKLTSRPAQPGVAAYHSFSSYSRSSFENCRKATMSLQNKEQPNNFLIYGYFIYNVAIAIHFWDLVLRVSISHHLHIPPLEPQQMCPLITL
ncbi:UNVERIFIED_CONTAM: putative protein phosphatase 2C 55 [Sesamum latifolium]|uniref:Uncharacterized protein n=1 Tax=Sesamum latifolium TaxID=2727402 RepID=A0AAW2VU62_9LAMI